MVILTFKRIPVPKIIELHQWLKIINGFVTPPRGRKSAKWKKIVQNNQNKTQITHCIKDNESQDSREITHATKRYRV